MNYHVSGELPAQILAFNRCFELKNDSFSNNSSFSPLQLIFKAKLFFAQQLILYKKWLFFQKDHDMTQTIRNHSQAINLTILTEG